MRMFFWLSGRFLWSGDIAGACNDYDENKDNDIDSGDYDGHYNDQHSNDVGDEDVFLAVWQVFVERRYCRVCPIIHVLATVGHCCYDEDIEDANRELGIGN